MSAVLVVDDDADIRLLLRLELSSQGHEVIEAEDGQAALGLLEERSPDLVLLDLMMPVLDGWAVLERLPAATAPPVVVITAAAGAGGHVASLLEAGALDVVTKPFDPAWLLRLVDAVLHVDRDERDEYRRRRLAADRS